MKKMKGLFPFRRILCENTELSEVVCTFRKTFVYSDQIGKALP